MDVRDHDFFWNFLIMIIVLAPVALILRLSSDNPSQPKPIGLRSAATKPVAARGKSLPPEYEEKNLIPDRKPLIDPDPVLTRTVMDKLYANFRKVRDLQYKVEIEEVGNIRTRNAAAKQPAASVDVYVQLPRLEELEAGQPGFCRKFTGRVRRDQLMENRMYIVGKKKIYQDIIQHEIFADDILYSGGNVPSESRWEQTPQEKIWERWEAFDSIFGFNYVSVPDADNPDHKKAWLLKSWFGTLTVDKKTYRPITAVCYYPNGDLNLRQDFVDFHELPGFQFYFPKTIKVTRFDISNPDRIDSQALLHIQDLKINPKLAPDFFTQPIPR